MQMPWLFRRVRIHWLWLAAALLTGLLLHIATVLTVSFAMPHRGMLEANKLGPVNTLKVLPAATPGGLPLPFMTADSRYAVCRFDTRKGPVAIHASLGDDDWTIALYSPAGDNVYVVSGADLDRREIELLLTTDQDGVGQALSTAKDAAAASVSVGLSNHTGLALISAPVPSPAYANQTERLLTQATCQQRLRAAGTLN